MTPDPMQASKTAPRPSRWGPGFLGLDARPYRLEMAALTIAILLLLSWRLVSFADLNVPLTVFWFLWPDLVPFLPIGVMMRGRREWPPWGSLLYNATHTFLVWLPVFLLWSLSIGRIEWPLLAWAGHISMDRAVGYYLREMRPS